MSDYDRLIQEGLQYQIQESNRLRQREIIENAKLKDELYKLNQKDDKRIKFKGFSFYDIYMWFKGGKK